MIAPPWRSWVGALRRGRPGKAPPSDSPDETKAVAVQRRRAAELGRGRRADAPHEIPARGWKDILLRTWSEFRDDEIPMISAGVAFYTLLALFPGIGAFVAIWGLFGNVGDARQDLLRLSAILPGGAITLIGDQMASIAATAHGGLSLAAAGGLLVSLWSANGATKAILTGLNIAYDETEKRGLLRLALTSLAFTLGLLAFALAAAVVMVAPAAIERLAGADAARLFSALGWLGLFAAFVAGLAVLYRYGPSRDPARWRWLSWGSVAAGVAWLGASGLFSAYVAHFGTYNRTYGPLGAVVGFMTWTWLSSMVVLLGAELNSEIEHQTATDSTVGAPTPLGTRGAAMADTVGAAR